MYGRIVTQFTAEWVRGKVIRQYIDEFEADAIAAEFGWSLGNRGGHGVPGSVRTADHYCGAAALRVTVP